ncbi:MAG TPA: agmatinase [Chloroflexia bacterium]|nr:agmatinase [Chloroflexia bacterium]
MSTPDNFLGLPGPQATLAGAGVLVLPIPYEATVSYGGGTAAGPAAIITASQQVELYDREFDREPALDYGVHTLAPLAVPADPAAAVAMISAATAAAVRSGKLVVGLGGEHTVSAGFGQGLLAAAGGPITIVQIDAHCDLRDTYEGSPYSHACVARRLLELPGVEQILQLGIRSLDRAEIEFARRHDEQVQIWYAEDVHAGTWRAALRTRLAGRRVYLTIDVDGLDPSVVPATGTPEPDGLTWAEALEIIRTVARSATVLAFDCVELAPAPGLHAADYAVAKLIYKTMSLIMEQRPAR